MFLPQISLSPTWEGYMMWYCSNIYSILLRQDLTMLPQPVIAIQKVLHVYAEFACDYPDKFNTRENIACAIFKKAYMQNCIFFTV